MRQTVSFGCGLALLGVALAGVSSAGLIPGGGDKRTDCYLEFDVTGATTDSNHLKCMDGDPACDTDGRCQGTCTFYVQLCVNQTNVAGCTPSPFKKPLRVKGKLLPVPTTAGAEAACGAAAAIEVPVRKVKRVEAHATTMGSPPRDKDFLFLKCTPRVGACPPPTTSTTTAVSTTTTTAH